MPRQIVWIAIAVTMVYWFGQFWGCAAPGEDQNYKVLEEDRTKFESEPPGLESQAPPAESAQVAQESDLPAMTPATEAAAETITTNAADSTEHLVSTPPLSETEPSLIGLDRSHWAPITVRPDEGRTFHHTLFFRDAKWPADIPPPVTLETAMEGHQAENWSGHNLDHLLIQPIQFSLDMAVGPVRAIHPGIWAEQTTP